MDSFFEGNETTKNIISDLMEDEEDSSLSESLDPEKIATVINNFLNS